MQHDCLRQFLYGGSLKLHHRHTKKLLFEKTGGIR